ncbi:DUF2804 domain-containing protein [Isoptericola sp. 4D.3]|uniref:DUF2804 domain-containing protein n=1 Tax=Isoptericola peretonis TaxID=2918523 RepID=A0ABT0J074_9MICO|nr:DUF2804 domain-containing protein [Isoptericola sp. 4D.3]
MLPELTRRVPLTRPDGRLDRRAVGWARQPLVDTDGVARDGRRFLGRNKRWEYWGVVTPTHLLAVTVSCIDYAAVHEVWVLDRATERTSGAAATVVPARRVTLPGTSGGGLVRTRAKGLDVAIDEVPGGTRLRARTADAELDVVAELPPGSGRSGGRVIGLQVGGRWTDGTGSTENAVVVDGRLTYLPQELTWDYDLVQWRRPWRVTGGGLDATFTPFYDKVTRTNLGLLSSATDQCFGHWSGTFAPDGGEAVEFSDLLGWAEEVHNRW